MAQPCITSFHRAASLVHVMWLTPLALPSMTGHPRYLSLSESPCHLTGALHCCELLCSTRIREASLGQLKCALWLQSMALSPSIDGLPWFNMSRSPSRCFPGVVPSPFLQECCRLLCTSTSPFPSSVRLRLTCHCGVHFYAPLPMPLHRTPGTVQ